MLVVFCGYIRVSDEALPTDCVRQGYSVRMSDTDVRNTGSPSLIAPSSIQQKYLLLLWLSESQRSVFFAAIPAVGFVIRSVQLAP
jgi:hypothetical protein